MAERSRLWRSRLLWPAQRCSLCALRVAQRSIGHRPMRGQTVDQVVMPLSIYQDSCRSRETCSYTLPARPDRNDPDRRRPPLVIACSDGMKWERGDTSHGWQDKANWRSLASSGRKVLSAHWFLHVATLSRRRCAMWRGAALRNFVFNFNPSTDGSRNVCG
jgi:hypothetical protein